MTETCINSTSLILFWEKISRQKLYIKVVKSAKEKEKEGTSRHHVTCCSLRFHSSSSAFCSSSIQLDVSYTHPSATTSMLYRCISVRPFLHSTRGGELGMGEIYELCGNRCAHSYAHETHDDARDRRHSRFFYSLVIKQFNITNTGRDNATWCEAPRTATPSQTGRTFIVLIRALLSHHLVSRNFRI